MKYVQELGGVMAARIGPQGLADPHWTQAMANARQGVAFVRQAMADNSLPLLNYPARTDDLDALAPHAAWLSGFERLMLFGTGGSSLGAMALTALGPSRGPELVFQDNLEPVGLARILEGDVRRTAFIVISKSGSTAETLAQTLAAMAALEKQGRDFADHFLFVTEPGENLLRRMGARHRIRTLDHDPGVGGRYSVLTLVGLLPAMATGFDAHAVRRGAWAVLQSCLNDADAAPIAGAAAMTELARAHGVSALVLMPYEQRLDQFSRWYAQLWAESLGKDGQGTLPVRALGPVDQHSQVQLYLGGPRDKAYTIILPPHDGAGPLLHSRYAGQDAALDYLDGRTLGDLLMAEGRATAEALIRNGRPTRVMMLGAMDEETMGALFMHFILETILAAQIMGVNAFDQPAVEEGKILTRQYLAETPKRA